jgi:hypothetical protein
MVRKSANTAKSGDQNHTADYPLLRDHHAHSRWSSCVWSLSSYRDSLCHAGWLIMRCGDNLWANNGVRKWDRAQTQRCPRFEALSWGNTPNPGKYASAFGSYPHVRAWCEDVFSRPVIIKVTLMAKTSIAEVRVSMDDAHCVLLIRARYAPSVPWYLLLKQVRMYAC